MSEDVIAVELIALKHFVTAKDCPDVCGQVLLANLELLRQGVKNAKKTLYVFCKDSIMNTIPSLTDLNSEVYDICLLHNKPFLNCIILNKFKNQIPNNAKFIIPPRRVVSSLISLELNVEYVEMEKALNEVLFGQSFRLFKSNPVFCEKTYDTVVIGGTFDRFHGGHKQLLSASLLICNELLVVGVTNDLMLKSKKGVEKIQPIKTRKEQVLEFCKAFDTNVEIEMHEIGDPLGPSVVDKRMQAIVVSSETLKGARIVNEKRMENQLKPLDCIAVRRTSAYTLSSTFLRNFEDSHKL